ncbi:MAG: hypothetical protein MOGMAGMI_00876 [Candidatus Omnitrophica bacterium]|nr:hypothetical protein [Candidatus Omnitrophota bacterium]
MNILIVKFGALGDVLRTTPVLSALRKRHPGCRITWITDPGSAEALSDHPLIDRLSVWGVDASELLTSQSFDVAVNLDKDDGALDAVMSARAASRVGFGRDAAGALCALDANSDYALRLGQDDELKFRTNKKTYQQICFEQLGLHFAGEEYVFEPSDKDRQEAREHLRGLGVSRDRLRIGLNTGSGSRFAGKRLPEGTLVDLGDRLQRQLNAQVLLLGGADEIERNRSIASKFRQAPVNTGAHPIRRFAAIVGECDAIVSGDTTAMHIALAVRTPVVAYFGSTCAVEIDLYGRGRKVVSDLPCAPCYKKTCPIDDKEKCMKEITADKLFSELKGLLDDAGRLPRS